MKRRTGEAVKCDWLYFKMNIIMRCPDYDDPTKIIDKTEEEYLCEYCCMRGKECDGRGNITTELSGSQLKRGLWAIRPVNGASDLTSLLAINFSGKEKGNE